VKDAAYKEVPATIEQSILMRRCDIETVHAVRAIRYVKTPFLPRVETLVGFAKSDLKGSIKDLEKYDATAAKTKTAKCEALLDTLKMEFQGLGAEAAVYGLELNTRILRLDMTASGVDAEAAPVWLTSPLKTALTPRARRRQFRRPPLWRSVPS